MTCAEIRPLLSAHVDRELDAATGSRVETHLAGCPACASVLARYASLGKELSTMSLAPPHDRALDRFESHVFARLERGVAWILLSLAAVLLAGSGLFFLVRDFMLDPAAPLPLRVGVAAGGLGLIVMTVSVVRHRLATRATDRYTEVQR